jgi:CBS-domain-containing membrane protein
MNSPQRSLLQSTAASLMSRQVILVPGEMSLRAAAHMLAQSQISGAPVIDAQGRCVGVLSTTDLIHWMDRGERAAKRSFGAATCACSDWQMIDPAAMPVDEVRRFMTTDLVTARPETPMGELARQMLDAHIHRVVIVDERSRPIGIVSSTDILAAVARLDFQHAPEVQSAHHPAWAGATLGRD